MSGPSRTLALSLLLLLLTLPTIQASGGDRAPPNPLIPDQGPFGFLAPISKLLSGRVWLAAKGMDPALNAAWGGERWEGERTAAAPAQAAGLVPYRSPSPKFSRNLIVSRDLGRLPFQTEPHLAVNPKDPDHLILGLIDYNLPNIAIYVSLDGGATWQGPFQPKYPAYDLGSAGDPTVAFDRRGNAYAAQISLGLEEFSIYSIPYEAVVSAVVVASSSDGGFAWGPSRVASRAGVRVSVDPTVTQGKAGEVSVGFLDKPWMVVGPDPTDTSRDRIYVSYTKFELKLSIIVVLGGQFFFFGDPVVETTIEVTSSGDGGRTWTRPVAVSPTVRSVLGDSTKARVVQGSNMAVAPDGTLYVAWVDTLDDGPFRGRGELWVARSRDGGRSFFRPVRAAVITEIDYSPRTASFRAWASEFPQLAVAPDGTLYMVYVARPEGRELDDGDVFIIRSEDMGARWSAPIRVNDDQTDRFQFFPSVAVDPKGVVHVMWGDFRQDPSESWYHIYYSRSEDRGRSWLENTRVTDFPSNPNFGFPGGLFIGDYFSIKATEADVYMAWADTRLGEFGPLNQKIGFARIRPVASPSIFVSPPLGPAGQDVIIQGSNFSPDLTVYIEVNGALVAVTRTDSQGRFTARIFMPISSQGAHSITASDASGNTATASFFTEFGFNTLGEQIRGLRSRLENLTGSFRPTQQQAGGRQPAAGEYTPPPHTIPMPYWAVGGLVAGFAAASATSLLFLRRLRARNNPSRKA
jgi:hypothetical protein